MTKTSGTESTPSIMTPTRDKKHPNSYSTSTSPLQYQHQSSEQSFQTNKQGNNNENNLINRAGFRQLIWDCLEKQMYSTAIFYAEKLSRAPHASVADQVLLAKCFQLSGEHRRCLVTLEHRGLLAAHLIDPICVMLKPENFNLDTYLTPAQTSILSAVYLAATCLFHLHEPEDTLTLLEPFIAVEEHRIDLIIENIRRLIPNERNGVNVMAGIYFIAGKCFDLLENRQRCLNALTVGLKIDPACIEIAEYISTRGLLSQRDNKLLMKNIIRIEEDPDRVWLKPYYSFLFESASPEFSDNIGEFESIPDPQPQDIELPSPSISALSLVKQAEYMYSNQHHEEAYRLARHAYSIDPYDWRGIIIYVATMVNLGLKNELFYLGHELVNTHPKLAISWYTVACYYWTCKKYEFAQKYLLKATKIDKRFPNAWVLLGHVLGAQEESEHAISAYRTACRVLPGNHEPQVFMAKELTRTNNYSLALHVLTEALELCPNDPAIMNELGVVYLHFHRLEEALGPFRKAAESVLMSGRKGAKRKNTAGAIEIFSNYATCLRRCGMYENALEWYQQCLAYSPTDAMTHANIGFTLHLSRRFDEAIEEYHRALSLQPSLSFCGDMLSQALEDMRLYASESATPVTQQHYLNSLIHTSNQHAMEEQHQHEQRKQEQEEEIHLSFQQSSSIMTPTHQQSCENSFVIHEEYSQIYPLHQSSSFHQSDMQYSPYDDSNSVESYSRIAGRLSLDST